MDAAPNERLLAFRSHQPHARTRLLQEMVSRGSSCCVVTLQSEETSCDVEQGSPAAWRIGIHFLRYSALKPQSSPLPDSIKTNGDHHSWRLGAGRQARSQSRIDELNVRTEEAKRRERSRRAKRCERSRAEPSRAEPGAHVGKECSGTPGVQQPQPAAPQSHSPVPAPEGLRSPLQRGQHG